MGKRTDIKKVLIIGSGPIIIGQACEFDYSGTQACKALRNLGYEIVLVNSNPATIMTDPGIADATYIEPLNVKRLEQIIAKERPDAVLPNLGGQSGLNLCSELAANGMVQFSGSTLNADIRTEVSITGLPPIYVWVTDSNGVTKKASEAVAGKTKMGELTVEQILQYVDGIIKVFDELESI